MDEMREAVIAQAVDTLARVMLAYGKCYDFDNATLEDARAEAEEIVSVALMDEDAKSVLNRQIGELQSQLSRQNAENASLKRRLEEIISG